MTEIINGLFNNPAILGLLAVLNLIPVFALFILFILLMKKMDSQTKAINDLVTQCRLDAERTKTLMDILISKIK